MHVELIKPIGYCYGVIHAINFAKKIKEKHQDQNVYIFGMLVHNQEVVKELEKFDIHTIDTTNINVIDRLNSFNNNDVVIFTAHGHPKYYEKILKERNIIYYDAVCPRVAKNIELIENYEDDIIYIGKAKHPETEACLSIKDNVYLYDIKSGFDFNNKLNKPLVLNQTTLSFLELMNIHQNIRNRYKDSIIYDEICDETKKRQIKIKNISGNCDLLIIIGGKQSSNTSKLFEIAKNVLKNTKIIMVENLQELITYNLSNYKYACLTSGTSTPIKTILEIENYLKEV